MARELVASGYSQREAARKLGIPPSTLCRWLARSDVELAPPTVDPTSLPRDPMGRLQALRDAWLTIAEQRTERLADPDQPISTNDAITGGIATQRALELHERVSKLGGTPEDLPADDDDARRAVMTIWYRHARTGSQAAAVKLAQALGVRSATRQPIVITFDGESSDATEPPPNAASPPALPA